MMMMRKNGCTFQWKIENFSYCWHKKGENFFSPVFAVNMKEETTEWKLALCPKGYSDGRFIGFYLCRAYDNSSEDNIEVDFEFTFLSAGHSTPRPLHPKSFKRLFNKGRISGCPEFMKREDLFTLERAVLLPQDILTVRCNMRRVDGESIEKVHIFARTMIRIEQMNFTWAIKDFSCIEPYQKVPFFLKSSSKEVFATLNLFLTGQCGSETICVELIYSGKTMKLFTVQSCILNNESKTIDNTRQEYCFDEFSNKEKFIFLLKKKSLIENKEHYLPKNVLSLEFECAASIGIAFEGIERIELGRNSLVENTSAQQKRPDSSLTLKDDLKSICCDGFLSDIMLCTATNTFPVHKIILSARSPVFMRMFSTDMKEKHDEYVDITDVSSETLFRLLLYIYTDTVEDLTMEAASELYEAADKYSVLSLKEKCSTFIKDNFSPSNVCQILIIADLHHDEILKLAVQDYILENYYIVFKSEEWKQLMETNPRLTTETMFRKFMKI
ncbi:Speckle-type POZ protein like [Argiope bruennichi]|uniref:Speckle-type POZ protein like n=2 Tax=Argiope bruennichi TaxID=94029 RepID=A0A8T0FAQ1_ARGBR|nr:Speckle-type POZ protein like [Argiope bruennichi]